MKYFGDQPSNRIDIRSSLKHSISAGDPSTRVKSAQETLTYIGPISEKIGVTRISEITFMDRLYIPNYSVVLPGTEDRIWVYNGKGTTRDDAKASALMEAIERHSALPSIYDKRILRGTYSELSNSYGRVLHPAEVVEPVFSQYDEKRTIMDVLPAFDLMNNEDVLVPAQLALYGYFPKYPSVSIFPYFHTNGIASGNILEEAICHALCELIERDAVSLADLCTSTIPFNILEKISESLERTSMSDTFVNIENKFVDDMSIYPDVDFLELVTQFKEMKRLIDRFTLCNIPLFLKDITQKDIGIPTFMASSVEWITPDYGYFAKGYGTHPNSRIALARAITELSQTRAANIHGARDDLKKIRYKLNDELYKRRWQFVPTKSARNRKYSEKKVNLNEIRTFVSNDILEDINFILSRLKKAGLKRAIIVDLTNPIIGIPVVRAIIPGLETYEVTNSIIGNRAVNAFKKIHRSH